jgi:hypothetical protein
MEDIRVHVVVDIGQSGAYIFGFRFAVKPLQVRIGASFPLEIRLEIAEGRSGINCSTTSRAAVIKTCVRGW